MQPSKNSPGPPHGQKFIFRDPSGGGDQLRLKTLISYVLCEAIITLLGFREMDWENNIPHALNIYIRKKWRLRII